MNYLSLLAAVAPVFVIIAVGFAIRRVGWLTREADRSLLQVGVNVLYPCLIADTILGNSILAKFGNLAIPPLVGFGTVILGFIVCAAVARLLRLSPTSSSSFTFTTGLYNYGYLPIPLVQAFYDRETLGVLFMHNLGVEIALWTAGVWILSGSSGQSSWRNLINVPIVAILASALLNFAGAYQWLPAFAGKAMHMMGQSAIPLALILTGATLSDLIEDEHPVGKWFVAASANLLRLGALPVAFLLLAKYLPISESLRQVMIIQAAMPSAMIPIILAKHYKADSALALQIVLSTTIIALLTIPLWLRFGTWLLAIP